MESQTDLSFQTIKNLYDLTDYDEKLLKRGPLAV